MSAVAGSWRALNLEQRVAAVGSLLLIVSTFGPFSFVEAAEVLLALGVLALLRARAQRKRFHLPFGDGSVILVAGCWTGLLIVVRLLDRPLGQNLLALACAAILALAGLAERRKRPPDDLPTEEDRPRFAAGEQVAAGGRAEGAGGGEAPRATAPASGPAGPVPPEAP